MRRRSPFFIFAGSIALATSTLATTAQAETLLEVADMVLAQNPQLANVRFQRDAAATQRRQAKAQLLPQLRFSYNLQRQNVDVRDSAFQPAFSASYPSNQLNLTLNQALYNGPAFAALRQVNANIETADWQVSTSQQDLLLGVADAWFELASTKERAAFNWAELQALASQLEAAQARYDIGEGDRLMLEETRARHDLARADNLRAEQAEQLAVERLRELTGRRIGSIPNISARIPPLRFATVEEALAAAFESNPALAQARSQRDAANANVRVKKAGHHPTVNLFAQSNRADTSESPVGNRQTANVYGVQVELPLFSGGRVSAEVDEAQLLANGALEQEEAVRRQVERQVRQNWLSIASAQAQQQALDRALRSAEIALESTTAGATLGIRTTVDVLNSRSSLLRARTDHSRARYEHLLAQLGLMRAAGQLNRDVIANFSMQITPLALLSPAQRSK